MTTPNQTRSMNDNNDAPNPQPATRQYGVVLGSDFSMKKPIVYCNFARKEEASIAYTLAEKFGVIAATGDGEDSAGRQKIALMPPAEVVKRACDIAALLVQEIESRGWYFEIPAPVTRQRDE